MSALNALGRVVLDVADQRRREVVEQRKAELAAMLDGLDEEVAQVIREREVIPRGGPDSKSKDQRQPNVLEIVVTRGLTSAPPGEILRQVSEYEIKHDDLKRFSEMPIEDVVELTVVDKYEEVFGKIPSVIAEMDRRSTQSVRFLVDDSQPQSKRFRRFSESVTDGVCLRLGARSTSPFSTDHPIYLDVTSTSTGWARAAFARICDEVEKGIPKWSFARTPFWRFTLGTLYFFVPWLAIMLAISPEQKVWTVSSWLPALATLIFGVSGTSNRLTDWLFPPFEITQDGAQPSGTRRLIFLGSLFVTVPVGIFVNQVS